MLTPYHSAAGRGVLLYRGYVQVLEKAKLPSDIYPQQLADIIGDVANRDDWQLVDVREKNELQMASIKNAGFINLPISEFQQVSERHAGGEGGARP